MLPDMVKVNPKELSDADYETGCRILAASVKCYFGQPGVQEEYEKWLETDEGKRASMPAIKRRRDAVKRKTATP